MATEHYKAFIKEAFLDPIRSVLIVDDDYPTFDEVLAATIDPEGRLQTGTEKTWPKNQKRIANMIASFRTPGRPLLVDIHDGKNVTFGEEVALAAHLHQSDLLVIDFELDKAKPRDGIRAIEIIRRVSENNHFNLAVVHTVEDLNYVFHSVLAGLMNRSTNNLSADKISQTEELIEHLEDNEEGSRARLINTVTESQYFHFRKNPKTYLRDMYNGLEPYSHFKTYCDVAGVAKKHLPTILNYLLNEVEEKLSFWGNDSAPSNLEWSDNGIRWIRSDSLFVAFSDKLKEEDLLEAVLGALSEWSPQPARLFLAKIRSVMDEFGVLAQGDALEPKYALAYWYSRLLSADKQHQRWLISESVSRHSDQLLTSVLKRVDDFALRLIGAELENGNPIDICKERLKLDLADVEIIRKAEREHNSIVCSKQPDGWHLATGHVLKLNMEYWVCLSPMCDLVPHQMSDNLVRAFGERLPFTAVKLHAIPNGGVVNGVQTNRFIFLRIDGEVKAFGFNNPEFPDSSPYWQTLFAEKRGVFNENAFELKIRRTRKGSRGLVAKINDATIVSQLRYEYALNLMQKLSISTTRVGLDFAGA
ncbi:MAG: hypothetical protein EOQ98_22700 [Mesorhizobium sp.]|uniref:response regulator receiver domain n=1 Tax=Mesorhizobium sp. TaxID=1871066 RepID=UPI000FE74401|nr:response regulator receiver domain [Mesorhizobium sp.]RWO96206.1 MAG: hypothetical protein EOQ98_22700 [Mesorhizobium sp.]